MAIRIVQSKQNARVKELRAALLHPGRSGAESVALEGIHLVTEALLSGVELGTVFVEQGHENLLEELAISDSAETLVLPRKILASALTTESLQPIAALAGTRRWAWPDLLSKTPSRALIVVLAGIQDPGNLGTILRSAEAFGASGVICLPGTVHPWNPKAMRASAGSIFRLPWISASEPNLFSHLHESGVRILAAMVHGAKPVGEVDLNAPVAFLIGAEGGGVTNELAVNCDARVTIPCPGPVESLNAAVAASVLLYEASRQRGLLHASNSPRASKGRRQT